MTLHCSSLDSSPVAADIFEAELTSDCYARLLSGTPLRAGWYRLKISDLQHGEIVELRLDLGLGFVGHHALRAKAVGTTAELFVRLFKPVTAVALARGFHVKCDEPIAEISFERLPSSFVWTRRVVEQLHIGRKAVWRRIAGSRHDRPRRLWGWAGLQAFPTSLPATGRSSYELWKRVRGQRHLDPSRVDLDKCVSRIRQPEGPICAAPRQSWASRTTVIIPTRNRADLLERCLKSILERTSQRPAEIIIHDNGSDEPVTRQLLGRYAARESFRVLRDELPFNFSRINNEAAAIARGDILIFLNNDTEVVSEDWIDHLAEIAADPTVGCAGPLLLTRNGAIQHAGLVTGPGGIAAHLHFGIRPEDADPAGPITLRDVSAVTGACLVAEKSKFLAVGGFDADHLPVAFNDVDLCLRFERHGLRTVFVPAAKLIHVGSATRSADDFTTGTERFRAEFRLMRERWGSRLDYDPYFPSHMRLTSTGPQLRLA